MTSSPRPARPRHPDLPQPRRDRDDVPHVVLRGGHELLACVPDLVGFDPTDSLVLLCLVDGMVEATMRVDLPVGAEPLRSSVLHQLARELGDRARSLLRRGRRGHRGARTGIAVAVVTDDPGAADLLATVLRAVRHRVPVMVTGVRCAGRWTVHDDTVAPVGAPPRPDLGPPGTPQPVEVVEQLPGVLALRSAHALAGRRRLRSRDELVASISPPRGAALSAARGRLRAAAGPPGTGRRPLAVRLAALHALLDRAPQVLAGGADSADGADGADRADGAHRVGSGPAGELAAELAVLTQDVLVRDAALARLVRTRELPWVASLSRALQLLPGAGSEEVAALLVAMAYAGGDGALAVIAADRVDATCPGHRLTGLLLDLLDAGVPPSALDGLGSLDGLGEVDEVDDVAAAEDLRS